MHHLIVDDFPVQRDYTKKDNIIVLLKTLFRCGPKTPAVSFSNNLLR